MEPFTKYAHTSLTHLFAHQLVTSKRCRNSSLQPLWKCCLPRPWQSCNPEVCDLLWYAEFLHCGVPWSTSPNEYPERRWAKDAFSEIITPRKSEYINVCDSNFACHSKPETSNISQAILISFILRVLWFASRSPATTPKLPVFPIALQAGPYHLPPVDPAWKKEHGFEARPSLTPDVPSFLAKKNQSPTRSPFSDLRRAGATAPPLILSDMVVEARWFPSWLRSQSCAILLS